MDWLIPAFDGDLTFSTLPEDFATRIQRRVESGLLAPGSRVRAEYEIMAKDRNGLTFVSRGLPTTYNLGLNEVTISRSGPNRIRYQVFYWGWTRVALVHGLLLGVTMAAAFALVPDVRGAVASFPMGPVLFWGNVGFWSLVWPLVLSAMHRPHAERALRRILGETLGPSPAASGS